MKILCIIIINHPSSIIPNCWISLPFCCFDCFCLKATSLSEKSTGLSTMSGLLSAYDTLAMCSEVQLEVECGLDSVGISWPDQYQPHPRWLGFYHPPREFRLSLGWRKEIGQTCFFQETCFITCDLCHWEWLTGKDCEHENTRFRQVCGWASLVATVLMVSNMS